MNRDSGPQPAKESSPRHRQREAREEILSGGAFSAASYANRFAVAEETAADELDWLAAPERETEGGSFYGVDKVTGGNGPIYVRVAVDDKLKGSYDMRGPASPVWRDGRLTNAGWTDKTAFYVGMSYGLFLSEAGADGGFNVTASHNGPADNGIKPAVRRRRGSRSVALLGAGVRLSSPRVKAAFALGVRAAGVTVYDIGTSYTPLIYAALAAFVEPGERAGRGAAGGAWPNNFSRAMDGKENGRVFEKMPSQRGPQALHDLQTSFRVDRGGQLAAHVRLEKDSDLEAIRGAASVPRDNAFARRHEIQIMALVRLGPAVAQALFEEWVANRDDFDGLGGRLESMTDADWSALQTPGGWAAFKEAMGLGRDRSLRAPPTASARPFDAAVGTDFASGSMWRMRHVLEGLGFEVLAVARDGHDSSRPDGRFPIHPPDPTKPEFQRDAIELSKGGGGRTVFMFDEDGDRFQVVVDGRVVSGAEMAALMAPYLPGKVVLTDVRYWRYVSDALRRAGKYVLEGPVGYAFYGEAAEAIRVALAARAPTVTIHPDHAPLAVDLERMRADLRREYRARGEEPSEGEIVARLEPALGIEGSGHAFFPSNGFANDGGYYMGMVIRLLTQIERAPGETHARALARSYDALPKNPFSPPELRIAMSFNATKEKKEELVQANLAVMESPAGLALLGAVFGRDGMSLEVNRMDGGKIQILDAGGSWLASALLRKSNNEPVFGTNFEGRTHRDKHDLEEWLCMIVAETTVDAPEGRLGADFRDRHTSAYFRESTEENDETTADGRTIHHPSAIERIAVSAKVASHLSPEARGRLGLATTPAGATPGPGPRELGEIAAALESAAAKTGEAAGAALGVALARLASWGRADEGGRRRAVLDVLLALARRHPIFARPSLDDSLRSLAPDDGSYVRGALAELLEQHVTPKDQRVGVIIAGGSGTRFFPLGRKDLPKQFIPLFEGRPFTLLAVRRLMDPRGPGVIVIQTAAAYAKNAEACVLADADAAALYRAGRIRIFGEPCAADTAAAVFYAVTKIEKELGPDKVVEIYPADHLVPESELEAFHGAIRRLGNVPGPYVGVIGIKPRYDASGFGHIKVKHELPIPGIHGIDRFIEKPAPDVIAGWKREGSYSTLREGRTQYLWNGGYFVGSVAAFRMALEDVAGPDAATHGQNAKDLAAEFRRMRTAAAGQEAAVEAQIFEQLARWKSAGNKQSIDFVLAEPLSRHRSPRVGLLMAEGDFSWSDVGSLGDVVQYRRQREPARIDADGNFPSGGAVSWKACKDSSVLAYPEAVVTVEGLHDVLVAVTPDTVVIVQGHANDQRVRDICEALDRSGDPTLARYVAGQVARGQPASVFAPAELGNARLTFELSHGLLGAYGATDMRIERDGDRVVVRALTR